MILFPILVDGPCWKCGNRFLLSELTPTTDRGVWVGSLCRDCQ